MINIYGLFQYKLIKGSVNKSIFFKTLENFFNHQIKKIKNERKILIIDNCSIHGRLDTQ